MSTTVHLAVKLLTIKPASNKLSVRSNALKAIEQENAAKKRGFTLSSGVLYSHPDLHPYFKRLL